MLVILSRLLASDSINRFKLKNSGNHSNGDRSRDSYSYLCNKNTYENTIFKEYTFYNMKYFLLSLGLFSINGVNASGNVDDKSSGCVERPIEFAYPTHFPGWGRAGSGPTTAESDFVAPLTGNTRQIPGVNDWYSSPGSFEKSPEADIGIFEEQKYMQEMQSAVNTFEEMLNSSQYMAPVLDTAINTLEKVVDIRGMGKKRRLIDDSQPAIHVSDKMKKIEEMQPHINDMERRLQVAYHIIPVLKHIVEKLQEIVNVEGMGRRLSEAHKNKRKNLRNSKKNKRKNLHNSKEYISELTHEDRLTLLSSAGPHIEHIHKSYTNMLAETPDTGEYKEYTAPPNLFTLFDHTVTRDMVKNLVMGGISSSLLDDDKDDHSHTYVYEPNFEEYDCSKPLIQRFGETLIFNRYDNISLNIIQEDQIVKDPANGDTDKTNKCEAPTGKEENLDAKQVFEQHFESSSAVLVVNGERKKVPYCEPKSKRMSHDKDRKSVNWIGTSDNCPEVPTVTCLMKAIESMQPQIYDMERRLGIMQSAELAVQNVINTFEGKTNVNSVEIKYRRLSGVHVLGSIHALCEDMSSDTGNKLVENCKKVKAIESMQTQIKDMERRFGMMVVIEHFMEYSIKMLQKVVDVRGMGKKRRRLHTGVFGDEELRVNIKMDLGEEYAKLFNTQWLRSGEGWRAVAITAAIKNIQKALTARILKRLDDGQPLVEVARKMKAIEGMQPQINDMGRRLGIALGVRPDITAVNNLLNKYIVDPMKGLHLYKIIATTGVSKSVTINNIQKALTAQILKSLDDGKPLVEVAHNIEKLGKMKSNIATARFEKIYTDIQEQGLENKLEELDKTLEKVVDIRGMDVCPEGCDYWYDGCNKCGCDGVGKIGTCGGRTCLVNTEAKCMSL